VNTVAALRSVDPGAIMVHVEATGLSRIQREDLKILEVEEQRRGYICYDLITGRVTPDHPLFGWLVRSGASTNVLAELVAKQIDLDVIGMNFYPQWSTQQLYVDDKGHLAYRTTEHEGTGFAELIEDYYRRYRAPVMITETSAFGDDELRSRWLDSSIRSVKDMRSRGVPLIGYTWFPMFTMIDWKYRHGRAPIDQYRIELGLYRLSERIIGARWDSTPLVARMQEYIANPAECVGDISPSGARLLRGFNRDHRLVAEGFDRVAEPGMFTREEKLSDGRYIVYYTFEDDGGGSSSPEGEPARAEEEHHV
jgi:beta-glucosidase